MPRTLAAFLIGGGLVLAAALPVSADSNVNPAVLPVNSKPLGASYSQWSARWWQWSFSVPASKNPAAAGNGPVDCTAGQSGSVWFLAGIFEPFGTTNPPGPITRSCSIPAGKALFFPLVNGWADNTCNTPPLSIDVLRALVASSLIPPSNLEASVDGRQFTNLTAYRAISPVFTYTLPPATDNLIFFAFGVTLPGPCWPSLTVFPAVADGFYLMLAPLSAGQHQLKFGGTTPGASQDFTYNLTVGS